MKNGLLVFVLCVCSLVLLQNCRDEQDTPSPPADYTGTPDTIFRPFKFPPVEVPVGISLTKEGVYLGKMLFYDPILSSDSSISCSSCHKQEFAFSDGGKTVSTNFFGVTKRNTPPIFNLVWVDDYFWDGRATALTAQAADALQHEQNFISASGIPKLAANPTYVNLFNKAFGLPAGITEEKIQKALAMFMMKLVSSESKFDSVMRLQQQFSTQESNGFYELFMKDPTLNTANPGVGADCFHCHTSTSASYLTIIDNNFHNNSLQEPISGFQFPDNGKGDITGNQLNNGQFRTPHLRNIAVTAPYMHDGRFATLRQVLNFYNDSLKSSPTVDVNMKFTNQGGLHSLSESDKDDIIAFLNTLTDHRFLTDTAFSNPFK